MFMYFFFYVNFIYPVCSLYSYFLYYICRLIFMHAYIFICSHTHLIEMQTPITFDNVSTEMDHLQQTTFKLKN